MKVDKLIFKSYDIRGIYGNNLFNETAEAIGRAFSTVIKPDSVIVGRDTRISSPMLHKNLIKGLIESGVNVIDIGLVSTDMYYFACATKDLPGIMITASHNPKEYNGFKMVRKIPYLLSGDEGIADIKRVIETEEFLKTTINGKIDHLDVMDGFVKKVLSLVDFKKFKKMKILVDAANGMAGIPFNKVFSNFNNIEFTPMYFEPNGNFPNHGGDPLQEENRKELQRRVIEEKFDLGFAFDTDGDRFFCIDKTGRFISGDFMTAILSRYFLQKNNKANIVYDIRASLIVKDTIEKLGGKAIFNRVGHAYIKKKMKEVEAIFAGEVTGHYYFKDFYGCDSGIVPAIYLLDFLSNNGFSLNELINEYENKYHISGEINNKVNDINIIFDKVKEKYISNAINVIDIDGITIEYTDWRFNVRASNTESLLRLNLEAVSTKLMEEKRDELLRLIRE